MASMLEQLKEKFPWLGTDANANGADVVDALVEWYGTEQRKAINDGSFFDSQELVNLFHSEYDNGQSFLDWYAKYKDTYQLRDGEIIPRNCPKCEGIIASLEMWQPTELKRYPSLLLRKSGQHVIEWIDKELPPLGDEQCDIECPLCNAVLFHDEEIAAKWLLNPFDSSIKPLRVPNRFYNVIRIHREDIFSAWEEKNVQFAWASLLLDDSTMENIASRLSNALLDGGDYHMGLTLLSEDFVEKAYEENKEEVERLIKENKNNLELKDIKLNCINPDCDWYTIVPKDDVTTKEPEECPVCKSPLSRSEE